MKVAPRFEDGTSFQKFREFREARLRFWPRGLGSRGRGWGGRRPASERRSGFVPTLGDKP